MSGNARTIAFRCDASISMGSGHVMRCITLAETFRKLDYRSHFICRELDGNLIAELAGRGFKVHRLPPTPKPPGVEPRKSSGEQEDALACREIIGEIRPQWVVVDNYSLASEWVERAVPKGSEVLVIDDLADRPLCCNIMLNQNFGRKIEEYDHLLPGHAKRLVGSRFALVRSEFAQARERSLSRRQGTGLEHLLIAFGGTDPHNCSGKVLACLMQRRPTSLKKITIILGAHAPHLGKVSRQAQAVPIPVDVRTGVTDMGELLFSCDAAIGSAGTSVWERCVLGIPSILLSFAENQTAGMIALDQAEAGVALGDYRSTDWKAKLGKALIMLSDPDVLQLYSERASAICDGLGADRVANAVVSHTVTLRAARLGDAEAVWNWRRGGGADRYYRSQQGGDIVSHIAWFKEALADRKRHLLIFELDFVPVGHIRLDRTEEDRTANVSICIDIGHRGAGLGSRALEKLFPFAREQNIAVLYAEIHRDNVGSLKLFRGMKFEIVGESGVFLKLRFTL